MAGGEDDRYAADLLDSPLPRSRSSRRRSEDNSARDGTPVDVSDGRENGSHRYREQLQLSHHMFLKHWRGVMIP